MSINNLRDFLKILHERKDIVEIHAPVDPKLELAEIHRRVIEEDGPALLFRNVIGSKFPVVTNLFGSKQRADIAFGEHGGWFIRRLPQLLEELVPPDFQKLWENRDFFKTLTKIGLKHSSRGAVTENRITPPNLNALPVITTWPEDGGPFFTLPLVYTEHPETGVHNLGMYRMQRFNENETGLHMQIGKGGGFHLARAKELGKKLPVNMFLGGPPAAILAAIAPLPENVPELLLASLLVGDKLKLANNPSGGMPLLAEAEFAFSGYSDPQETRPEGPFGDHYGYYSLEHDFPVFRCETLYHRNDAIYPATVVGKPRQEDFYIGDHLQDLLSPLFPLVMPGVEALWSYGETGYHSLSAAVVKQRYKREAMVSAFRILGEGQLSLTKFLLLVDRKMDLHDFRSVLSYILERADFRSDLYVFSHLSMDTLDYAGPRLNEGSKGVLLGMGEPRRTLPREFSGEIPNGVTGVQVFSPGCLVVSGPPHTSDTNFAQVVASAHAFSDWPLVVLSDDAAFTASSPANFLWSTFTRFEPAADIFAKRTLLTRYHPELEPPIVIDSRMKPWYPGEVLCDEKTKALVTDRWAEYFRQ